MNIYFKKMNFYFYSFEIPTEIFENFVFLMCVGKFCYFLNLLKNKMFCFKLFLTKWMIILGSST